MDGKRLLLAARLSTKHDGGDGIGLDTQDTRGREWAEREGYTIVGTAAGTIKGTSDPWTRKYMAAWLTPDRMSGYDGILVFKLDRLSRGDQVDYSELETWASQHGKFIQVVNGPRYPARDDSDYWQWTAEKRQARKEWEAIRERSGRAQDELRARGMLVGRPPFGYDTAGDRYNRRLVPTDAGRRYVPEIFARVIAGESLATIARWLDAEGVSPAGKHDPREDGELWWPRTLAAMIRTPTYMGMRREGNARKGFGRLIHECEPLVDAATFTAAGRALAGRPKRGPANPANRAMLAGVLRCGNPDCTAGPDSPMYRIKPHDGVLRYRCAGKGPGRHGCGCMVPLADTDAAVARIAAATFGRPVMTRRLIPGHNHDAEIERVKYDIQQLAMRELDDDAYDAELRELRAERDRLRAEPAVPDRVELVPTGQTYASLWDALADPDRAGFLAAHGFRVSASRAGVLLEQGRPGEIGYLAVSEPLDQI